MLRMFQKWVKFCKLVHFHILERMQFDNVYLTHHRFPKRGTLFLYANHISLQQSDLCDLHKVYHINMNIYHWTFFVLFIERYTPIIFANKVTIIDSFLWSFPNYNISQFILNTRFVQKWDHLRFDMSMPRFSGNFV